MSIQLFCAMAFCLFPLALVAPSQDADQKDGMELMQGKWTIHFEKTTEELKTAGFEDSIERLKLIKGMTLILNKDGKFEMLVPMRPGITGKWTATVKKSKEAEGVCATGRISLAPDNLDDEHEDMHFDYVLIEPNVARLTTPINPVPLIFSREKEKG